MEIMEKLTLIPTDDPQQALRIRRLLMGLISYLLYTIQTLICWYLDIFTWQVVVSYLVIIATLNISIYFMLRTGFNKRFADPSMTLLQLISAIPTGLFLMYHAQDQRMLFVLMGVPVFLYGVFQFQLFQFLLVASSAIIGYVLMMLYIAHLGEQKVDIGTEILTVTALLGMMAQISMLGAFIARLRQKIKDKNAELATRNQQLESSARELQQAHEETGQTLHALRVAHEELVRKEKLAALGSLVAGIAHEINTPIGNSLLAASALNDETRQFHAQIGPTLRAVTLNNYIGDASVACDILLVNLRRAADLVTSFKQVAIDQTSSQRRQFPLLEITNEILMMVSPMLKQTSFQVVQDIPSDLILDSYPGPLGQVLTNLLNNAILHGFDGREQGHIQIGANRLDDDWLTLWVSDNGNGISADNQKRVFDPFFTTKLGTGGSGLGLNITHNIVTGILGGKIEVRSNLGEGTRFTLTLPRTAPQANPAI